MEAAALAKGEQLKILAVTVLTSIAPRDLAEMGIGLPSRSSSLHARAAGRGRGLRRRHRVGSRGRAAARRARRAQPLIVTPGIRPADGARQRRPAPRRHADAARSAPAPTTSSSAGRFATRPIRIAPRRQSKTRSPASLDERPAGGTASAGSRARTPLAPHARVRHGAARGDGASCTSPRPGSLSPHAVRRRAARVRRSRARRRARRLVRGARRCFAGRSACRSRTRRSCRRARTRSAARWRGSFATTSSCARPSSAGSSRTDLAARLGAWLEDGGNAARVSRDLGAALDVGAARGAAAASCAARSARSLRAAFDDVPVNRAVATVLEVLTTGERADLIIDQLVAVRPQRAREEPRDDSRADPRAEPVVAAEVRRPGDLRQARRRARGAARRDRRRPEASGARRDQGAPRRAAARDGRRSRRSRPRAAR